MKYKKPTEMKDLMNMVCWGIYVAFGMFVFAVVRYLVTK
jgi:hypothetical protein